MPEISIIIPNYNGAKYLKKCINSVINQSFKNIEVIIIDDGSIDDSVKIIKEFAKVDSRIILIEQPNMNASVARNHGIKNAVGEYIFFLDSDDYLFDDFVLEKMYKDIQGHDLLIGNYVEINCNDEMIKKYNYFDDLIDCDDIIKYMKLSPPPSNKLYKLKIVKNNNVYFSNVRIAQDLNFYLKYLINCQSVITVDYDIYNYRVVDGSMTRANNLNFLDIVNSFNEIIVYYNQNSINQTYYKYIYNLELRHYCQQMSRIFFIDDKQVRKIVYYYINHAIEKIDFKEIIKDNEYKKSLKKVYLLRIFHPIILSNIFMKFYLFLKNS